MSSYLLNVSMQKKITDLEEIFKISYSLMWLIAAYSLRTYIVVERHDDVNTCSLIRYQRSFERYFNLSFSMFSTNNKQSTKEALSTSTILSLCQSNQPTKAQPSCQQTSLRVTHENHTTFNVSYTTILFNSKFKELDRNAITTSRLQIG